MIAGVGLRRSWGSVVKILAIRLVLETLGYPFL